jgi:hypothetical protein
MSTEPLADPVAEALRLISAAQAQGLILRAIGGVAVYLQAREGRPRLPRRVKDIDLAAPAGSGGSVSRFLDAAGYQADQMFNALRSGRRLLYHDLLHHRHLDVFVGEFAMCHEIPLTGRLDREPLTVPREELLLSKLQIVELTENDQNDIYNLLLHHDVGENGDAGISSAFVAALCARDWGLWRTCQRSIGRSLQTLEASGLDPDEQKAVGSGLESLQARIDAEPKSLRWRMRSQVGDRVRWYQEPEEEQAGAE